jgi:hypothetical protein
MSGIECRSRLASLDASWRVALRITIWSVRGDDYRTYRSKVTMGVPRIGSRKCQCQMLPATSMAVAVPQYPVGHARHVLCLLGSGPVTDQRVKKHGTRAGRPTLKFLGFERENCGPLRHRDHPRNRRVVRRGL